MMITFERPAGSILVLLLMGASNAACAGDPDAHQVASAEYTSAEAGATAPPPAQPLLLPADGTGTGPVSSLARYEKEFAAVNEGRWFSNDNNDVKTLLGWGESYVMTSLALLFEKTRDARYLDRLAEHADGVLAQRDNIRGVKDYRDLSLPCWRSIDYTSKPYCFGVHTGLIAYPMVELAAIVKRTPSLATHITYDGKTLAQKAAIYTQAGIEAANVHDDEWRDAGADKGYYVFRPDMTFYAYAGKPAPYNQMNGLAVLHLALAEVTSNPVHKERARRMANHLLGGMRLDNAIDGYVWNYWDPITPSPEDVSHAGINVFFMWRAESAGVVFNAQHLDRVSNTLMRSVYVDTKTSHDHLSSVGATNGAGQRPQIGRWGLLTERTPLVGAMARDLLEPVNTGRSGSVLMGRALLFDDSSLRPWSAGTGWQQDNTSALQANAANPTIAIAGSSAGVPCATRIRYKATQRTTVQQVDARGGRHRVAVLAKASPDTAVAHIPYDPKIGGNTFRFVGADQAALELEAPRAMPAPVITSTPPPTTTTATTTVGSSVVYQAAATSDVVTWWSIASGPAVVEPWTGKVTITPTAPGTTRIELRARNDYGVAVQVFDVTVGP